MSQLPQALFGAAQVRELDRIAIEERGIDGYELMTRAGTTAFRILLQRWPRTRHMVVLCGSGNNGGDGYVVARLARAAGMSVRLIEVAPPKSKTAARACQDYRSAGGEVEPLSSGIPFDGADVVVDALLGTGLEREVAGDYQQAIDLLNRHSAPVLAIDIPSGLHSDTGGVMGRAVRADATITFIGMKLGLFTGRGRAFCGELIFDDLAVPDAVYLGVSPLARRIVPSPELLDPLRRSQDAHKGAVGRVAVVGGEYGMPGAPQMAAHAAYRTGGGLVRVITRPGHTAGMAAVCPELLVTGADDPALIRPLLEASDVIAIGPGLGQGAWGQAMLSVALDSRRPLVVDADALNLLAQESSQHREWVLTPHPGEAGRLLGTSAAAVQADRVEALRRLAERFGAVVVLKGSGSLVGEPDSVPWLCDGGNPGMATGGMGDVLTGVIASLAAQGLPLQRAARLGVWLHAAAADHAVRTVGEMGLMASDLHPYLSRLLTKLTS